MADNVSKAKTTTGATAITAEAPKVVVAPKKNFLQNKKIKIKPVIRSRQWASLLEQERKDAFMYNSSKRTYTLPVSGRLGSLVPILDNNTEYETVQYPGIKLTEQGFFEKALDKNLNLYGKKEENFWYSDNLGMITLTKDGVELDLNTPLGMLRYKILTANKNLIAKDKKLAESVPTYEYYIEDAEEVRGTRLEFANKKMRAFKLFNDASDSPKKLAAFLKVSGKGVNKQASLGWLKEEVYKMVEEDPETFLMVVEDELFEEKAFVYDALSSGALIRKGRDEFALDTGTVLGNINSTIAYLNKKENSAMYNIMRERINRVD